MTSIFDELEREAEQAGGRVAAAWHKLRHEQAATIGTSGTTTGGGMSLETRLDDLKTDVEDVFARYAPDIAKDAQTAAQVASSTAAQSVLAAVHLQQFPDLLDGFAALITKADAIVAQAQEGQAKAEAALTAAQAPAEPVADGAEAAAAAPAAGDGQPQTGVAV
jgi:hypothetical protein